MDPIKNVDLSPKANIYFDGNVISHSFKTAAGEDKSTGAILPGEYHFGTAAPERMDIIAGQCSVVLDGTTETLAIAEGSAFEVPGNSGFTITVAGAPCQYICSYLSE
ncbi:MAG: pyrimidine/purine nucleoside phosphorylase [Verrucomicrobiales bacterium]|nr:pyrimidine/purine nucleoside phosphorylase [Verrucomicrobiota bacterium JB025]